ncbi:MAG: FecR domain-containing protein [Betaproteobacteria bacterium]|nr:FecR domain-containing protein [Betaproteobacteria bacterium]
MRHMALAVFLMGSVLAWADEESTVRITQSDGSVEIVKSGAQAGKPAKEGDLLERGDRLVAREKSAALLLWSNGSIVKVYPNTEIALAGVSFDLEKKMEKTLLDLDRGRIFVKAQVPEHLFCEFKVRAAGLDVRTQGAEFALAHDAEKKSVTAWSLTGRLVSDAGSERVRIDDGQQSAIRAGARPGPDDLKAMDDKTKQSLAKVSKDLGGSLLLEEGAGATGGKLVAKIGGVAARRGSTPFKVGFKALVKGGSGKLRSVTWDFGDGESASAKDVEHTFTQGLYVVILRVEDENGEKASAQTGISVEADCGC